MSESKKILKKQESGFIKSIILILGALIVLKYIYSIDVVGFLTTGKFKIFLDTFYKFGYEAWIKYREVVIEISKKIIYLVKILISKI